MRYYSTTAGEMVLQTAVTPSETSVVVDTTAGLPVTFPYTLILDYGSSSEEVVDVTSAGGTTLTVVRGKDGTVAQSHAFGAKIRHGITARDLRESREHEDATAAHGATGAVVGTDGVQTLKNKTAAASAADAKALTVKGTAGQTAVVLEVQDGLGTARVAVDAAGTLAATPPAGSPGVKVTQSSSATVPGVKVALDKSSGTDDEIALSPGQDVSLSYTQGDYNVTAPGTFTVSKHGAAVVRQSEDYGRAGAGSASLTVRGGAVFAGATDILSARTVAGVEVAKIDKDGNVTAPNITTLASDVTTAKTDITNLKAADVALDSRADALETYTNGLTPTVSGTPVVLTGTTTHTLSSASWGSKSVTFPQAFAATPVVIASVEFSGGPKVCGVYNITTAGFTVGVGDRDSTPVSGTYTIQWVAIGAR